MDGQQGVRADHKSQVASFPRNRSPRRQQSTRIYLGLIVLFCGGAGSATAADKAASASPKATTNRLASESSPYLRLHAHNPVDWYAWGPEALEAARRDNKPIFLSIGYSSCYWCHVMERLVFSNAELAREMNQRFINIKVDREERPDLDDIYMLALQVYFQLAGSSQGGGWPLSIFLTPEGQPIAGGTYFPPEDAPGRPGFSTVMKQIHGAWSAREKDVRETAELITREVQRLSQPQQPAVDLDAALVSRAVAAITERYDADWGGFDFDADQPDSAKFPVPVRLQLIQSQVGGPRDAAGEIAFKVDLTLRKMTSGGLRDHLGGGFHRYSTDRQWRVPHFEKMLYDNAQLVDVFVDAHRRTGLTAWRKIVEETCDFVLRDLQDKQGGFHAALDAETNGVEGQHYVWSRAEIERILSAGDARVFLAVYGFQNPAEFEPGHVLYLPEDLEQAAQKLGLPLQDLETRLAEMRGKLLKYRESRPALLVDTKILTGWNGLMIRGLARAGAVFKRRDYIDAAERAAVRLLSTNRRPDSRLLRLPADSSATPAYLEDYAYFISGLLALHDATGEDKWLTAAKRLTDEQIRLFQDVEGGGFYFTANDQEVVLARSKNAFDSVLPSGNGVSVQNLVRLARATSDEAYRTAAQRTLNAFSGVLATVPAQTPALALGLQEYLHWYGNPDTRPADQNLFVDAPAHAPIQLAQGSGAARGAGATPQLTVAPDQAKQHEHVRARGFLSSEQLPAGGRCQIAIEIEIAEGWHINANPAQPDFVIPTKLTLGSAQKLELKGVRYPPGHAFPVDGFDAPLSVYEKKVTLLGEIHVPATATGADELSIAIDYQACNSKNCLRPMKLTLTGRLPVAPPGAPVRPANAKLFETLNAAQR